MSRKGINQKTHLINKHQKMCQIQSIGEVVFIAETTMGKSGNPIVVI